ncbi:MAG: NAD-dependent dehydratase, partial [Methyloceanibacter sp.]
FYVPGPLLEASLRAARGSRAYTPLFGSLVADPAALQRLNWRPRVATEAGLAALLREDAER